MKPTDRWRGIVALQMLCLIAAAAGLATEPASRDDARAPAPPSSPSGARSAAKAPAHADWQSPLLVGKVAMRNSADIPGQSPEEENFYPVDVYLRDTIDLTKVAGQTSSDPDSGPIAWLLQSDIRETPYPTVAYFVHATKYNRRRAVIQEKIEAAIAATAAKDPEPAIRAYTWMMLYLGEFEKILVLFAPDGPYAAVAKGNGDILFALSQANFRLGHYEKARALGEEARPLMPNAILDVRWNLMLTEVGLYGRSYLDQPDGEAYTKRHIRSIFKHRAWEDFPFIDVTEQLGVERWGGTGSVSFVDLDRDGWDDLIWERKFFPPQIYKNLAGKRFQAIPRNDLVASLGTPIIFTAGDVDNDGLPDLFRHCCNYDGPGPVQLLSNLGGLKFRDITEGAGIPQNRAAGMVVAWSDYDLDGWLDMAVADAVGTTRLYRNTGKKSFEEVSLTAGVVTAPSVGASFGDYDGDGWPDLWVTGWDSKTLFRNRGDGTFVDVTREANLGEPMSQKGYISFMFDHNNDGRLDLFAGQYVVSSDERWGYSPICTCSNLLSEEGYSEREWRAATTIFENRGDGTFENISRRTNFIPLGMMGSDHGDWNNDGYEDLIFGTGGPYFQQAEPFLFYQNDGGTGTFTLITPFEMLSLWGKGHGAAFSDFNHDGHLDLATNNGGATPGDLWPSLVLQNKGNANHWLQITLKAEQPGTNAMAVGARVSIAAGAMKQVKEVQSGGQFGATNSLTLHFGLGPHEKVDKIVVRWPNRSLRETVVTNVPADRSIEIAEATGEHRTLWAKAASPAR